MEYSFKKAKHRLLISGDCTWQVARLAEVVLPCCRSGQVGVHLAHFNIAGQLRDRAERVQRRLLLLSDKQEVHA